uniref:Beta/gamma crystallin 'Greek key' domain-containing protein n=1 Tax=Neogobius melanostomus TaxID=47308 RepID=A0A8C6U3R5_9GOBI
MSIRQKKAIVDVKNRNKTISSSSVNPPREDPRNKQDSSKAHDEVTSSSPQQSLDDKEDKTVGPPLVKKSSDLRIKKSQRKLTENVRSSNDKNPVEASNSQCDLNNKEGNASADTQEEEAVSTTDKIVQEFKETIFKIESEVPTVKQVKSMQKEIAQGENTQPADTTSKETTGNEQNLPSVKQAVACAIDKTEPHSAEQLPAENIEYRILNMAQATQRESKQEASSGELEKVAERRLRRPCDKLKGTAEGKDKGPSNEVQKSLSVSENKEVATTSEQPQASDKLEGATKRRDEMTPNKAHKSVPSKEKKIDLASVKKDVAATSGQLIMDDKADTGAEDKSTLDKPTKEIIVENNANSSNAKNESDSVSEVQKNIGRKDFVTPAKSAKTHEKATIQDSSLQLEKDEAKQDATEEKIAHLSVSKPETDPSNSSDETKTPIHKSPAILPQKDQEIASPNSAPFTRRTDGHVKNEKGRLASDLPATGRNANKSKAGREVELLASELQSKQDAEAAVTQGVIEKGGKLVKENVAGEIETFERQVLDHEKAKLGQATNLTSQDKKICGKLEAEKQEHASKISPSNTLSAEESVGAENNALSVNDNEGEREGHTRTIASPPFALTKSTKIHGKETEPKLAAAAEPQAVTVEKNSQNWPDESAEQSSSFTANQGVLAVAKNEISEQKDVVKKASSTEESEKASSDLDNKVGASKMPSESPLLARDLIKQASGEFEKAITNITSGKTGPTNEQLANGDVTVLPKGAVLKDEAVTANKQSLKTLPEAKTFLDSSRKRHNLAKGRCKDDWSLARHQDAPSSWLDSSGSESNLLDTSADLDDEDFVEKIKKLCAPFQLPPKKHNHLRPPQPPFAMPAIREDRFEKTFDPEEFTFGLRQKKFSLETPSLLAKLQSSEGKTSIKPARASLADRSMLLSGLDSRFRDKINGKEEQEDAKDEVKHEIKVKSRLEGSCVLSSLTTSSFRSKLSQSQAEAESTESGNVSPSNSPNNKVPSNRDRLPSVRHTLTRREVTGRRKRSNMKLTKLSFLSISARFLLKSFLSSPTLNIQIAPHSSARWKGPAPLTVWFPSRVTQMLLFEKAPFEGQLYEVHRDMEDATSLLLSAFISVKVIRGCWVLYEKPGFQGRTIALEEGSLELTNVWAEPGPDPEVPSDTPMQIGSIRLAVADYSIPHIDLFTDPEGRGRVTAYHDDALETGSFGIPLSTASIQVHSGVWLVFSDPGFQGMLAVLETGGYPFPETWGFPSPFVGSLRPLKMAVVYEKAGFEGPSLEVEADVFSFGEEEGDNADSTELQSVGSLKVHGGLWVGYSEPGFEGQQYILEEGEYPDCAGWGGAEILSIRPIMSDFMSPHIKMFSDRDFGKLGVNINLTVPVINLDETGYGLKTQSMDVLSGVWVVFEEAGFCGESYVVEKGQYGCPEDWGATRPSIASAMPVLLVNIPLFSNDFSGRMYVLDEGTYPDLRAMGCVHTDASILSMQIVGFEFSVPSIILFERSGLKGKRVVLSGGVVNLQMSGGGGRVQSVLVEGGMWVLYEEINFRGAQVLLRPGEVSHWRSFCHWRKIGSLRPLLQKQVHFHLRNRLSGQLLTLTGDLDDIKLLRVQEAEETHGFEQIWFFQSGQLRCKLLEECCLCPSSSVTIAGARVGVTQALDEDIHLWSITPEGFICYSGAPGLVLDIKGEERKLKCCKHILYVS